MTSLIFAPQLKSQLKALELEYGCFLVVGIQTEGAVLATCLSAVNYLTKEWPSESSIVAAARKLRRTLIGNVYIIGVLYSTNNEKKITSSMTATMQGVIGTLRSTFEKSMSLVSVFYNGKAIAEHCNFVFTHGQAKNSLQCRKFPDFRNVEVSFVDLENIGSWMKGTCSLCLDTSTIVLSDRDLDLNGIQQVIKDLVSSLLGNLTSKNACFLKFNGGVVKGDSNDSLLSLFPADELVAKFELLSEMASCNEELEQQKLAENSEALRVSVCGKIETAVCLHSKYSTASDLYTGLLSDIVFSLTDLLTTSIRSYLKDSNGEEDSGVLSLPKRLLPESDLPNGEDILTWSQAVYDMESEISPDVENSFRRDQIIREIHGVEPKKAKDEGASSGVSLDSLSCSSSYGAAVIFLGGFVIVFVALFLEGFFPHIHSDDL